MSSIGLLEKIEAATENAKHGTLAGTELETTIKKLSTEVAEQSARILSLGSQVYPRQISNALDILIKTQRTDTETNEIIPIIPDAIPQGGDGLEKVEGDFTQAI